MFPLIVTLVFIALLTFIVGRYSYRQSPQKAPVTDTDCATCGLVSTQCHDVCTTATTTDSIVYFDDEELDRFCQHPSDKYSEAEIDEFADILHTMQPEEVPQWLLSLKQRDIALPDELKQEVCIYIEP